jgi:hypothetical protein
LSSFTIVHPRPFDILGVMAALGLDVTVAATERGEGRAHLRATVTGPRGELDL